MGDTLMTFRSRPSPFDTIGVNVVILSDRTEVCVDEIATVAEGQRVLADVEATILAIEAQLEFGDGDADPGWRPRAEATLRIKRRLRPKVDHRISELRRADRKAARVAAAQAYASVVDGKRRAFIAAAETALDRELFTEIWARAEAMYPAAFEYADEVGA